MITTVASPENAAKRAGSGGLRTPMSKHVKRSLAWSQHPGLTRHRSGDEQAPVAVRLDSVVSGVGPLGAQLVGDRFDVGG
jgi:hypothetical protein